MKIYSCLFRLLFSVALLSVAVPAAGFAREGFWLEGSLWLATDIVVVEQRGHADETSYLVVETWRGSLQPGDRFEPGELVFALDQEEPVVWDVRDRDNEEKRQLDRRRMVLFLRDSALVDDNRLAILHALGEKTQRWLPANKLDSLDFSRSAVWLDRGEAYWLLQTANPGPLHPYREMSELRLELHVRTHELLRQQFEQADKDRDAELLARVAAEAIRNDHTVLTTRAFDALKAIGAPAFGAVRKSLFNDFEIGNNDRFPDVLRLMGSVGGAEATADLVAMIDHELYFFENYIDRDPDNRSSWWVAGPAAHPRNNLAAALESLDQIDSEETRKSILAVRQLFATEAALQIDNALDRERYGNVVPLCDRLLERAEEQ